MGYTKNHRTPAQLTGVARGAFDAQLDRFPVIKALFPVVENYTLDYAFTPGSVPLPPAASFRSWNTESEVAATPGQTEKKGKLPPTSLRTPVDEHQQLVMYGQEDLIGEKFEEYATRNAQSVAFRVILAAAQALCTGKVTLAERKLAMEIAFGRPTALDATAATVWTAGGADPLGDLEALRTVLKKRVTQTTISRKIMVALQKSPQLISFINPGQNAVRVSAQDVADYLSAEGFGRLTIDETTVPDRTGTEVPVLDEKKVILTSGESVGSIQMGVTAESIQPDNGIGKKEQPGLFSGAIDTTDPEGYDVLVSGIVLPVLTTPLNSATLKVLA